MKSGLVDMLGFIGGSKAADALIADHPHPHRLKVFSQLEGKNLGVVLPDADVEQAVAQCVLGGLSYNGQRCTAIKLIMVHEDIAEKFVRALVAKVASSPRANSASVRDVERRVRTYVGLNFVR